MKTTLTMTTLKLFGAALPALALATLGLVGCDEHYTTQEAYDACRELLSNATEKDDPEVFSDCVACHEDCGTDCNQAGTSPVTFSCPEDDGGSSSASGSGSGSDGGDEG